MTGTSIFAWALVVLNAAMVAVLLRLSIKLRWHLPWLPLLAAFFALRAGRRMSAALSENYLTGGRGDLAIDATLALVLIPMVIGAERMARSLEAVRDEAEFRAQEYERARRHYTQVVRHRVLNPVTIICGGAETIKAGIVDEPTRDQLCDAIVASAREIQQVSLEPERRGDEEYELDAIPRTQ